LGESFEYELTNVLDEERNELSILSLVKPSFASFSALKYTFNPVYTSHLGNSLVKGIISDSYLQLPFSFMVTVEVDPPRFKNDLLDQKIELHSQLTYILPDIVSSKLPYQVKLISAGSLGGSAAKLLMNPLAIEFSPSKLVE
jgi:hypothetical protein